MGLKAAGRSDHALVSATTTSVLSVGIVQPLRAVNAQPDLEVLIGQEGAPILIEESAIGLEVVPAGPPRGEVALLELDGAPVEVDSRECRLATVPDKADRRPGTGLNVLADKHVEHIVGHPELMRTSIEVSGVEIVAVVAL